VVSFEELARLQDILSPNRENLAHQITGSADCDDRVFDVQASRAYVEDFLQDLGVGNGFEFTLAHGLQEVPA
jgi:hypothetical protein